MVGGGGGGTPKIRRNTKRARKSRELDLNKNSCEYELEKLKSLEDRSIEKKYFVFWGFREQNPGFRVTT